MVPWYACGQHGSPRISWIDLLLAFYPARGQQGDWGRHMSSFRPWSVCSCCTSPAA